MADLSRDEVQAQLPWYAAGALSPEESGRISAWLAQNGEHDQALLDELAWLERTARQVQGAVSVPPAEQGLNTLLQRVRHEARLDAPTPRWSAWLRAWRQEASAIRWGLSGLVVVQCLLIVVLVRSMGDSTQVQLSGPQATQAQGTVRLQLVFSPQATEAQIRALLLKAQVHLVAGPSALGVYIVQSQSDHQEEALRLLREHPQVVESASVQGAP
jgi:hypothetical protein